MHKSFLIFPIKSDPYDIRFLHPAILGESPEEILYRPDPSKTWNLYQVFHDITSQAVHSCNPSIKDMHNIVTIAITKEKQYYDILQTLWEFGLWFMSEPQVCVVLWSFVLWSLPQKVWNVDHEAALVSACLNLG